MANLALQTTFAEFQDFAKKTALPASARLTISFDDVSELEDAKLLDMFAVKFHQTLNKKSERSLDTNLQSEPDDFADLEAFGMWADREDMKDSTEYIRKLRRERW